MLRLAAPAALCLGLICVSAHTGTPPHTGMNYANDHWQNSLDLYLPAQGCSPYPLAIFMHGGGWYGGDAGNVGPYVNDLLNRGIAVASVNYRWSFQAIFPAQIHDCKAAVRFLRANAAQLNLDPNRFAAFGDDAGGHLAALLGTSGGVGALEGTVGNHPNQSSRVIAVADVYGPTDMFELGAIHNQSNSMVSQLFGWPIQDIIDHQNDPAYAPIVALVHSANPITHVSADDAAFYIVHGDADTFVPPSQSQALQNALAAAGVNATLEIIAGEDHTISATLLQNAFNFLAAQLGVRAADINCDGAVNVNDLLAVINSWGACPPQQTCPADVTGDGAVNVNDLLLIISSWG